MNEMKWQKVLQISYPVVVDVAVNFTARQRGLAVDLHCEIENW